MRLIYIMGREKLTDISEKEASEKLINISKLVEALDQFAQKRDWGQFHSPKNLVMALSGEVGELTALFQWLTENESSQITDPNLSQNIRDELADVLFYLIRLASVLKVDLNAAAVHKLKINEEKYPADKFRGSNKKYNQT